MATLFKGNSNGRNPFLYVFHKLTGKIENMKIGILKEGFGLKSSEPDVDKMVRDAAEQLGSKCGAVVEEISVPMHSDGNLSVSILFQH